jgi:hypothetical protein
MMYSLDHQGGSSSVDDHYTLPMYSGESFRKRDAKSFKLSAGEQRAGEDLLVPLSKLHSMSGTIIAARDGHIVNGGGIALLNADDKTEVLSTKLTKESTIFVFEFVPEGDYLIRLKDAKDVEFEEIFNSPGTMPPSYTKEHTLHSYGSADVPVHVEGDTAGLTISVPESAPTGTTVAAP